MTSFTVSLYYGVFWKADHDDLVRATIPEKYKSLLEADGSEPLTVGESKLIYDENADTKMNFTIAFIAVDDLTIEGPSVDSHLEAYLDVARPKADFSEASHMSGVNAVTEIHEKLIIAFRRLPKDSLYCGWRIMLREWDGDSSEEERKPHPKDTKIPRKQATRGRGAPKSASRGKPVESAPDADPLRVTSGRARGSRLRAEVQRQ